MPSTPFIESPRFPDNISYGSGGGPGFKTYIFEGFSGVEYSSITWSIARAKYNANQGIRDKADMDTLRAFFYMVRGRAIRFRYKDWGDYELEDEVIGTGDGVQTVYKITKTYGTTNPYVRRIFKPVADTVVVKVDGVVVPQGAPAAGVVTLDDTTGLLTFGADVKPALGKDVTVTCEFDVPCRFDTDVLNATHEGYIAESWSSIPIVEVTLEDVA